MNVPFKGQFKVTQLFKGSLHDGLDIVAIGDERVYSTIDGLVERAGWENASNRMQGFGIYVRIKENGSNRRFYFGHLSFTPCEVGQYVKKGQYIGVQGSTGRSTGPHLHYCCRENADKKKILDICKISGIPNKLGVCSTNKKTYLVKRSWKAPLLYRTQYITQARIFAQARKCVVYDEFGKTIYSFRGD